MLDTKLILVEGFPGAGKSTTTGYLRTLLQDRGYACRSFLEEDDPHPIDCLDYEIRELTGKMVPLWGWFVDQTRDEDLVTIIESRLWQNTAFFMYMSECGVEEVREFSRQVWQVLAPISPVLVYLYQEDVERALRRLYTVRGEEWMEKALETTTPYPWFQTRGLHDFEGWVQFFKEWQDVVEKLYDDWPGWKIRILNPHEDWGRAYQQLQLFLHVRNGE